MYDAIIVGARCAGSPTAMLLARRGHKVLLVDRASFPSDTLSTHVIKKPAVALLERWGLLDQVLASGCPPITHINFDLGPFVLGGRAPAVPGTSPAADADYSPRRTILDKILVDAAVAAGAELRQEFSVKSLLFEDGRVTGVHGQGRGRRQITERARIVVGADGISSLVAQAVAATFYNSSPALTCATYAYWDGVPIERAELCPRPGASVIAFPTNDNLTCILVQRPAADYPVFRSNVEQNYLSTVALVPSIAERVRGSRRVESFHGTANLANYFRKPFGPGWALVGDAGLHRDPITAQGISDAFRDAVLLSDGLDAAFSGRQSMDDALGNYEQQRNVAAGPIFDLTCQIASLNPPPDLLALLAALHSNQAETDRFIGAVLGTVPIPEFFAPANVERIMAVAALKKSA
jgi:flavin-dependent dehydrogenase